MIAQATLMFQEAGSSGLLSAQQLAANRDLMAKLGTLLRERRPRAVITIARGSSDHAATFARYLIETRLGILTSSLAPSISSVYEASLDLENVLCLAVSQSGKSPDLIKSVQTAKAAGARPGLWPGLRGGAEIQGNLRPACRGLQQRRGSARPMALVGRGLPVLAFAQRDETLPGLVD